MIKLPSFSLSKMEKVRVNISSVRSTPVLCKTVINYKFSSTTWCKTTINLVGNSMSWKDLLFVACSAHLQILWGGWGVRLHCIQLWIPAVKFQFTHVNLFENVLLIQSLPPRGPAVFSPPWWKLFSSLSPHWQLVCALHQQHFTAQTSSMYRSPSLKKPISVVLAAMNMCATVCCALFPVQLPLSLQMSPIMLQCATSSGYIKSNLFVMRNSTWLSKCQAVSREAL